MYQVIARKYRPRRFEELVGQQHVRTTLANAINSSRIAHGYIFSGQRGTGKTTVARILARCLNCKDGPTADPCGQCSACQEIADGSSIDVIEIDAASNRGINEMRELRENVRYRPARDRYKVFIIDEAHQVTPEAFNALLKTLEEPPEWVVFILCTTEPHKIPPTIASRCQHFSFRSIEFDQLVSHLQWICDQEGITAEPEALAVLAQAGEGSLRDSLSALDQAIACCGNQLTAPAVRQLLGSFSLDLLGRVAEAVLARDPRAMLEIVENLEREGHNLSYFCRELSRYFRNLLVARIAGPDPKLIPATDHDRQRLAELAARFTEPDLLRYLQLSTELFSDLQRALQPRLHLELGLLRMVHAAHLADIEKVVRQLASSPADSSPERRLPASPPATPPQPQDDSWKTALHAALLKLGLKFTADAVEHSQISATPAGLHIQTPRTFKLAMKEGDILRALELAGRPVRSVKITFLEDENAAVGSASHVSPPSAGQPQTDIEQKAMADPEVQKFVRTFGGEIRAVRELRSE